MSSGGGTLGVPFYDDDVIAARCAELSALFDDVKAYYAKALPDVELHLDETRLLIGVTAYFHDIARYKWWHYRNTDPVAARLNGSKKAAYLCYWINKIGPGSVTKRTTPSAEVDAATGLPVDISLLLNAHFALHVAMMYLEHRLTTPVLTSMLYQLQWRNEDSKSLLLLFDLFDMAIRGDQLVLKASL